ncbi:unnamed protein product [Urochloa humidicola]
MNETTARGASTRQRGGRAPRPPRGVVGTPPPHAAASTPLSRGAAATPPPPPPVGIDLIDPSGADWCDDNTRVASEIMADEVLKGNRANTHLSKTGYKNLIERFEEMTGIVYTRLQFKNKWDKLKSDYNIWKQLKNNETGIGWDEHARILSCQNLGGRKQPKL